MKHYKIYGMHFTSDFELIQLKSLSKEEALEPIQFTIEEGIVPDEYKFERMCYSKIDQRLSFLSNRTCYLLIENGNRITYEKKSGAKDTNLNAYLLGWGVAMLCFQQNRPAIHCSCVADERGAVLISGRSGSGKSTVTTALLQEGYSLVADDMVIVETDESGKSYALPAFPYQKLCRDVAVKSEIPLEDMIYIDEDKDKFLVPYKGEFPKGPVPIRAMVFLGWDECEQVTVQEIKGADKMHACLDALFLKVLFRENLYCLENGMACLKLASSIPIYEVKRSQESNTVREVVAEIRKL